MPLSDYPDVLADTLGLWNTFRRMGYKSDWLYFSYSASDCKVSLVVQHPKKSFSVCVGRYVASEEEIERLWTSLCDEWISEKISDEELHQFWDSGRSSRFLAPLLTRLVQEGLPISSGPLDTRKFN
jgi:hypothetical protein